MGEACTGEGLDGRDTRWGGKMEMEMDPWIITITNTIAAVRVTHKMFLLWLSGNESD